MSRSESRPTLPPTNVERAALNGAEDTFAEAEAGSWADQATAYIRAQGRLVFDSTAELHAFLAE